jgi:hypothetical protein
MELSATMTGISQLARLHESMCLLESSGNVYKSHFDHRSLVGLVKLAKGQGRGLTLSNFGITFGGSTRQENKVGNVAPELGKSRKPDLIALGSAGLGFLTALVGLLKA